MQIPFIDLRSQFLLIEKNLKKSIHNVLEHGKYINGPEVKKFEDNLSEYTGVKHSITCANGTDALTIALLALDVEQNDAVFVPSFTYIASAEAIALIGATPYFVDVGDDYNICPFSLETAIDDAKSNKHNPKIVIPVDLFGKPSICKELDLIIEKNNLKVIYDSAQSFGASYDKKRVGNFGDITTTSFFPAKPLGCYGDGGAIFTNDDKLAYLIRSIKNHGMGQHKYEHINIGMNSRLDSVQAAILIEKLKLLEEEIIKRNKVAEYYDENINCIKNNLVLPEISSCKSFAWAQYTLRCSKRDSLVAKLKTEGVPTAIYYPIPLNEQKAYKKCNVVSSGLPNTQKFCKEVFSIPMSPYLTHEQQNFIIEKINSF
tara:strand:- start:5247 stop:6365 length:1119 start_codon:yes stop_codon:yes gene_type:complete